MAFVKIMLKKSSQSLLYESTDTSQWILTNIGLVPRGKLNNLNVFMVNLRLKDAKIKDMVLKNIHSVPN